MSDIRSSEDIVDFLYKQAAMRAPENDMGGTLIKLAQQLRCEAIECGDWNEAQLKYVEAAKLEDPAGATCGWCNQPNTFADDNGWFMANPLAWRRHQAGERWDFGKEPKDFRYTCRACWFTVGAEHEAFYGVSDR